MIAVLNLFDIKPGKQLQYAEYLRRVLPILKRYHARILVYGQTRMLAMGNCTQQYCGLIGYKSLKDLRELSHDPEFIAIRSLRDESTMNYVLTTIEDFPTMADAIRYLENGG